MATATATASASATKNQAAAKPGAGGKAGQKLKELTGNGKFKDIFPQPENIEKSIKAVKADMSEVPVMGPNGKVSDACSKLESDKILTREDKDLIWSCLAVVRDSFLRLEEQRGKGSPESGYQWNMNWKHTRAEVDQVLEAARLLKLDAKETRDAIIASTFSDAIKNRKNFIVHNIDGAEGAAQALSYFLNPGKAADLKSIERICRAIKEHQIAPPEFMAKAIAILITQKLRMDKKEGQDLVTSWENALKDESWDAPPAENGNRTSSSFRTSVQEPSDFIKGIYEKVYDPFNKRYLNEDLTQIQFTAGEKELLALIGVEEWYVPHPDNPDSRVAHAVIAGDHSINYNHPEGFAKIALIRGPDTDSIFEDPTVHHSLDSAVRSFADSFRVIRPEVQPLAVNGLRRTKTAVQRVIAIMTELFNGVTVGPKCQLTGLERVMQAVDRAHHRHPSLFTIEDGQVSEAGQNYTDKAIERVGEIMQQWFDRYGKIPFNPNFEYHAGPGPGTLPFWNAPLLYPRRDGNGQPILSEMSDLQLRQFLFADKIREIAVELLRAEQWIF